MIAPLCQRFGWTPPLASEARHLACLAFVLMGLYLWVLPTGHTVALRNLLFFSWVGVTLWAVWRHGLRMHFPLARYWGLYGGVALLSLLYAVDPLWSLGEVKREIGYGILVFLLAATWVRNERSLERLGDLLAISNMILLGALFYKVLVLTPFWQFPLEATFSGALLNTGEGKELYNGVGNFSTYLITVMPLFFIRATLAPSRSVAQLAFLGILFADVLALLLTGNRMGLLVLGAEFLFIMFVFAHFSRPEVWRKILLPAAFITLLLGALAGLLMHVRPTENDPRWPMWAWAINDILADPLRGGGFGRTVMVFSDPEFRRNFYEHAHNMIINKGVQMGLPGIAAFLLLFGAAIHGLWPRRGVSRALRGYALAATTMAMGVFLKNMTDDFFVSHNARLFWLLAGATLGALAGEREKQTA